MGITNQLTIVQNMACNDMDFRVMGQIMEIPEQNGCHFADGIFKCIFMNEKFCILIWISLKFVLKGLIDTMSALV